MQPAAPLKNTRAAGLELLKERKVRCLDPMDNNIQDNPILLGLPISIRHPFRVTGLTK
jgi:hypothetical protein